MTTRSVKVENLEGDALDWAVAKASKAEELEVDILGIVWTKDPDQPHFNKQFRPSTDWAQGGPLISEGYISRTVDHSGLWIAYWTDGYTEGRLWVHCAKSELVAGLRTYVSLKSQSSMIEIPEVLL